MYESTAVGLTTSREEVRVLRLTLRVTSQPKDQRSALDQH